MLHIGLVRQKAEEINRLYILYSSVANIKEFHINISVLIFTTFLLTPNFLGVYPKQFEDRLPAA